MPRRSGYKHTIRTIEKIKKSNKKYWFLHSNERKGKNNSFFNKHHTEETKARIRQSKYHKNLGGKENPNYNNHKLKNYTLCNHHVYIVPNSRTIKISFSKHSSLHRMAYRYILEKYGKSEINSYLKWFKEKYGLKIYE